MLEPVPLLLAALGALVGVVFGLWIGLLLRGRGRPLLPIVFVVALCGLLFAMSGLAIALLLMTP